MKLVIFNNDSRQVSTVLDYYDFEPINLGADIDILDNRGKVIGEIRGLSNNYIISDVTPYSEGDVISEDDYVANLKELMSSYMKMRCDADIESGFTVTSTGNRYGYSVIDQGRFTRQIAWFTENGWTEPVPWKTTNKGVFNHTIDQFKEVVETAKSHEYQLTAKLWQLEVQIANCYDINQLKNIHW